MQLKLWFKLIILGGLSIFILIALASIGGITYERKNRMLEVQSNIAESYAGPQQLVGPFFAVTYRETWTGRFYNQEKDSWYEQKMSSDQTRLVYPKQLTFDGSLAVQPLYRGLFKAQIFQSTGHFTGSVQFPKLEGFRKEAGSQIEPLAVHACVMISDPRGVSCTPTFVWNGTELNILPGSGLPDLGGIHAVLPEKETLFDRSFEFVMDLNVHGMGQFSFVPVAADNQIRLDSTWPHPSFTGDFLANDRTVSDKGFAAQWNINNLACSAQQKMDGGNRRGLQHLGVDLIDPVNPYSLTGRALKYGFLFIFITFAAFLLYELIRQLRIHPIQYGFVGLAQALFFLLLLSLSEHLGFGWSYFIASLATIAVLVFYLCSVLRGFKQAALFGVLLAVLYGVLYGLLQSEDLALVAGSLILFALTALVMLLTRNVNWYTLTAKKEEPRS